MPNKGEIRKLVSCMKAKLNCIYAAIEKPNLFTPDTAKELTKECLELLEPWLVNEELWKN